MGLKRTSGRGARWASIPALLLAAAGSGALCAEWPQWGGPNRDFKAETGPLADEWARSGPKRLWQRALGDGYSGIVYDDGVLYTLYRTEPASPEERAIALDARSGQTLWERANPAPLAVAPDARWGGLGPNATPLIVGGRLFTVGSNALLHCLDKRTGRVLWSHDLVAEYGAPYPNSGEVGYSASPVAYEELVIVSVGRKDSAGAARGQSLVAFDGTDGREVWKALDFGVELSSPILIRFGGRSQLVLYVPPDVVGVDPRTGAVLWSLPIGVENPIASPAFDGKDRLFCLSPNGTRGSTAIRLVQRGHDTVPELLWTGPKPVPSVPTPVVFGDHVFGGTKTTLFGLNLDSGELAWVERGYPNAACVYGDGKLVILDEYGKLTLATATAEGLTVHARSQVTERYSFTAPTLVGRTLYVRDRERIMALDLGTAAQTEALQNDELRRRARNGIAAVGLVAALAASGVWLRRRNRRKTGANGG